MLIDLQCETGTPATSIYDSVGGVFFNMLVCVDSAGDPLPYVTMTGKSVAVAYQGSDPVSSFADGNLLGWGVVAAMALAYGIHLFRRAL